MNNFSIRRRGEYALIFTDRPDPKTLHEKVDVIEVVVAYNKDASSQWGGGINRRGIYVHVNPVTLEKEETCTIRTSTFSGTVKTSGAKIFVKPLARKNDKALVMVAEMLDILAPEICRVFRENPNGAFELIKNAFATDTVTV